MDDVSFVIDALLVAVLAFGLVVWRHCYATWDLSQDRHLKEVQLISLDTVTQLIAFHPLCILVAVKLVFAWPPIQPKILVTRAELEILTEQSVSNF